MRPLRRRGTDVAADTAPEAQKKNGQLFRSTSLSPSHYAGKWVIPTEQDRNDLKVINKIGYEYAIAPDSPEKEATLLHVLECFHGYLTKYLVMIVRGTVPPSGTKAGRESRELLRYFAPRLKGKKGAKLDKQTSDVTCKMLHLAFKGQTTEDIYDTMVFCFMKAVRKYDPHHAEKVKAVCKVIDELPASFTIPQLNDRVGYDCGSILRALVRKGFLSSVRVKKKLVGYQRAEWPAPAEFFESGPIGFTYVVQMWFRFYLNEYITQQMAELESGDNVWHCGRSYGIFIYRIRRLRECKYRIFC